LALTSSDEIVWKGRCKGKCRNRENHVCHCFDKTLAGMVIWNLVPFSQLRRFFSIQRHGRLFLRCIKKAEIMACFRHQAGIRTGGMRFNFTHFTDPVVLFRFDTRCIRRETGNLLPGILRWRISRSDTAVTMTERHSLSHNIMLLLSKSFFLYHPIRYEN
jgi:hypothetical protein